MPAQGVVTVEVSPSNARMVAWWLRTYHQPTDYQGMLGEYLWSYRDHHDVNALARKFEKLIARKRVGPSYANVVVQLSRVDAVWFAQRVQQRSGMFGHRPRPSLPKAVEWLCYRCMEATTKKRGRKPLKSERLQAALQREHLDERHRKRLKRRQREEELLNRRSAGISIAINSALARATKFT